MKKILFLLLTITFIFTSYSQKKYKEMMHDNNINFYDVVKEAENHFATHDKNIKGSGWKGYSRWKKANEYKYYPSGRRDNIDPFFVANAYKDFLEKNNITQQQQRSSFNNGWESLGPAEITTLAGHYSVGLGRVEDHYVDPNNANLLYLGSRSGGLWKSVDGGSNWTGGHTDFLPASGVNTFTVSPTNPNEILINVQNSDNSTSHGVYRSIDGGMTWAQTTFNPTNVGFGGLGTNFKIHEIRYHPTVANLIFIGTSQGMYKSTDNLTSVNWTITQGGGDVSEIQFHPTDDTII